MEGMILSWLSGDNMPMCFVSCSLPKPHDARAPPSPLTSLITCGPSFCVLQKTRNMASLLKEQYSSVAISAF